MTDKNNKTNILIWPIGFGIGIGNIQRTTIGFGIGIVKNPCITTIALGIVIGKIALVENGYWKYYRKNIIGILELLMRK